MKASCFLISSALLVCLGFIGCDNSPTSVKGMVLPEGDEARGIAAFSKLQCTKCHTVAGVDFPAPEDMWDETVQLGGRVYRVKNYGELVTSITNPDHVISEEYKSRFAEDVQLDYSLMPILIDEMSVRELLDLVTFLGKQYKEQHPDYSDEIWFP